MEKQLLKLAESANCEISQDSSGKWTIKGLKYEGKWKLEQQEKNRWLLQFNDAPGMILNTEETIKSFNKISGKVNKVIISDETVTPTVEKVQPEETEVITEQINEVESPEFEEAPEVVEPMEDTAPAK